MSTFYCRFLAFAATAAVLASPQAVAQEPAKVEFTVEVAGKTYTLSPSGIVSVPAMKGPWGKWSVADTGLVLSPLTPGTQPVTQALIWQFSKDEQFLQGLHPSSKAAIIDLSKLGDAVSHSLDDQNKLVTRIASVGKILEFKLPAKWELKTATSMEVTIAPEKPADGVDKTTVTGTSTLTGTIDSQKEGPLYFLFHRGDIFGVTRLRYAGAWVPDEKAKPLGVKFVFADGSVMKAPDGVEFNPGSNSVVISYKDEGKVREVGLTTDLTFGKKDGKKTLKIKFLNTSAPGASASTLEVAYRWDQKAGTKGGSGKGPYALNLTIGEGAENTEQGSSKTITVGGKFTRGKGKNPGDYAIGFEFGSATATGQDGPSTRTVTLAVNAAFYFKKGSATVEMRYEDVDGKEQKLLFDASIITGKAKFDLEGKITNKGVVTALGVTW